MNSRPIGVFDSGFGGLTAVRELRRLLPGEDIVFFADNGRAPYGTRSAEAIRRLAAQDLALLSGYAPKAILAACGTVSSTAGDLLRESPIPAFGIIEATANALAAEEGKDPVGLIATGATVSSGAFEAALRKAAPGRSIFAAACPDFVTLIESGRCAPDDPALRESAERYLRPLREGGVTTLVLGCTHYGLIAPTLREIMGGGVSLLEASRCAAGVLAAYLTKNGLTGGSGTLRCLTSGDTALFTRLAPRFLGEDAPRVEPVPIMEI